jgi:magnesium chelatase family protein
MLARLRSAAVFGIDAHPVHVEVDVSRGFPSFTVVGLPDASVRESRDRVRTAIRNSGFEFPPHRITINLAPADVRKAGASFDLPIALGILAASGAVHRRDIHDILLLGELSLDGGIQPTRGVLPIAVSARRDGIPTILLPSGNVSEASVVKPLCVIAVDGLQQAVRALNNPEVPPDVPRDAPRLPHQAAPDFDEVRGQLVARRALEVAAAGGHNILMVGPPGVGKTLIARRAPGILPPLTFEESLESTSIHSVAGLLPPGYGLLDQRPFRAPHHTISDAALVGGGSLPRPGEISLAHNGVLFLDELPEFDRRTLEVLRQPLEEGSVTIARAARSVSYPARFMLVAAMNPCMCGYAGHPLRPCRCTPQQRERYRSRISGPLLDRIDLCVELPWLPPETLADEAPAESSASMRERVLAARSRQTARECETGARLNAHLGGRALRRFAGLNSAGRELLDAAMRRLVLSGRAHDRILRVARTVADLAGSAAIRDSDVAEALQYRMLT